MFYSAQTKGFYDPAIHGNNIPSGAVEITKAQHQALMHAQAHGKVIKADANGSPVAQDRVFSAEEIQARNASDAASQAALNKLASLGLSEADLVALGLKKAVN